MFLNVFLMRGFYFKRRVWKLLTLLSNAVKVKSAWEKRAVLIQYLRSDEMLTGFMSVSLFYHYFHNLLWNKKSLTALFYSTRERVSKLTR